MTLPLTGLLTIFGDYSPSLTAYDAVMTAKPARQSAATPWC